MTQKDKRVLAFLIKNATVALWLALVNGLLMNWEASLGVTRLLGETVPPALGALAVTFGAMRALRAEAYARVTGWLAVATPLSAGAAAMMIWRYVTLNGELAAAKRSQGNVGFWSILTTHAHAAVVYDAWFTVLALAACIGALALTIRAAYARRRGQLHTTADL